MMKVYCIPGFGVDDKIFSKLKIKNAELHYINWLTPLPKEDFTAYCKRMAAFVIDENPVLLGVSFGGMVALEIAKLRPVQQIILISSVKNSKELPAQLRLIGKLKLNKIFPVKKIKDSDKFYEMANRRLGAVTDEEKTFANAYRRNANLDYVNWSFNQILNWKNNDYPKNIVHIHGSRDMIFPIKNIHPTHIIDGGTHMMVMNRAAEISNIINDVLRNIAE